MVLYVILMCTKIIQHDCAKINNPGLKNGGLEKWKESVYVKYMAFRVLFNPTCDLKLI